MHRLVPALITENLRQGNLRGELPCAALFVDMTGFTAVTEALMVHGQYGAEVLATIMRAVFAPVVQSVFEHGGFVTNFAGDALTAVFPGTEHPDSSSSLRALSAATHIQQHMRYNSRKSTRFGAFTFSAKIGLATGHTTWGILLDEEHRRAAYYFRGSAISGCAEAQKRAQAGDIVIDQATFALVRTHVLARPVDGHEIITRVTASLPLPMPVDHAPPDRQQSAYFFPPQLVEQAISGEFRQIFNLFISLQGTPDHDRLKAFARQLFRLQGQFGGLLNRIDFGDKGCHLLLFWGAPVSHENDLRRVLDFTLELRQTSPIPLRAGITYRIAHAGFIGSPLAEEYTCYGRGVNLAARYMMAANWGEIWLDEESARRAESSYDVRFLGPQEFKGFAEPQAVYVLAGAREAVQALPATRPLIGRRAELSRLEAAMRPLSAGRAAGVVTVVGEAGIGKSRLVQEFLRTSVALSPALIGTCQTDEILRRSLNPFRYFLDHYFDQSATRTEAANKERFEKALERLLAALPDAPLRAELQRTSSFIGALLDLRWENSLYEQLEPELRFQNTLAALKTLFRAESRCQPVIILLEDAHWLDPDSRAFLKQLTRNITDYPIALLVTSRKALPGDLFDSQVPQTALHLQALNADGVGALASTLLRRNLSPQLVEWLARRADGNPYFTEQLLLYLQEKNLLEAAEKAAVGPLSAELPLPTDVRAVLTARLDRLPWPVKDTVQEASVLGREFEKPILALLAGADPALEDKLALAAREAIWQALDSVRYLFGHALLRDAAYEMQLMARLRQLHALAARAYERQYRQEAGVRPRYAAIAYHFDRAEEQKQACTYYGLAGEQAKDSYHNEDAIAYFSRALDLAASEDWATRYRLLSGRATIFEWQGRREEQQADLDALGHILAAWDDDQRRAELALRRSAFALVTGDYDTAVTEARASLAHARRAGDVAAIARAHQRWGRTLWQGGQAKKAALVLQRALYCARQAGSRSVEAESLYDMSMAYRHQERLQAAETTLRHAVARYEEIGDEQGLIRCLNLSGIIAYQRELLLESLDYLRRALQLCRAIGWRYAETHLLQNIGNNYFDLGDHAQARDYHQQALALAQETGDMQAEALSLDTLGLIAHYSGNLSKALNRYERARAINGKIKNRSDEAYVLTHMGFTLLDLDEHSAAIHALESALLARQELGQEGLAVDTLAGLAWADLQTGNTDRACERVEAILAWIAGHGTDSLELPLQDYLICYRVLEAAAGDDPHLTTRAGEVLEDAHRLLQERLERLPDRAMQQRYLNCVAYNLEIQEAWLQQQ